MGMEWKQVSISRYRREQGVEEEPAIKILRKEKGYLVLRCASCRGKGISAYGGGTCFVCRGQGETTLHEPIRKCVFCGGTGQGERATATSCLICKGKGAISVIEPYERCPDCKGRGKRPSQKLPCSTCSGKGIVPKKEKVKF